MDNSFWHCSFRRVILEKVLEFFVQSLSFDGFFFFWEILINYGNLFIAFKIINRVGPRQIFRLFVCSKALCGQILRAIFGIQSPRVKLILHHLKLRQYKNDWIARKNCLFWNWRPFPLACVVSEKAHQFQNKQISSSNPVVLILSLL